MQPPPEPQPNEKQPAREPEQILARMLADLLENTKARAEHQPPGESASRTIPPSSPPAAHTPGPHVPQPVVRPRPILKGILPFVMEPVAQAPGQETVRATPSTSTAAQPTASSQPVAEAPVGARVSPADIALEPQPQTDTQATPMAAQDLQQPAAPSGGPSEPADTRPAAMQLLASDTAVETPAPVAEPAETLPLAGGDNTGTLVERPAWQRFFVHDDQPVTESKPAAKAEGEPALAVETAPRAEEVPVFEPESEPETEVVANPAPDLPTSTVERSETVSSSEAPAAAPDLLAPVVAGIDQEVRDAFPSGHELQRGTEVRLKRTRQDASCIVFSLDGTQYAVPIHNVLEMDKIPRITSVPNVPGFVRGVTNLRGEIVSVLDLRNLFGMERTETAERGRILVVRTADHQTAAFAVDEVRGTAALPLSGLSAPTSPVHDKVMPVLMGVGDHQDRVLNVLDVDKIFRMPEMTQFVGT